VRVLLAAAGDDDDVLPHFRTCTRKHDCLTAMGFRTEDRPTADQLHVDGCEVYERTNAGARAGRYERTVGDETVILRSGTPVRVRRPRAGAAVGVPAVAAAPPRGGRRAENQHSKLYGLLDSVRHWDPAALAEHRIVLENEERSLHDLFVDARLLDYLSFDSGLRATRRRDNGPDTDETKRPHVFFGPASAQIVTNGAIRIAFEGGIDLALAFEPADPEPAGLPAVVNLSVFINNALLNTSRNQRMFQDDLNAAGVNAARPVPCYAFVLGRLRKLTSQGYLNAEPLGTTEDIVVLSRAEAANFTHLVEHLRRSRIALERQRRERVGFAAEEAKRKRLEAEGPHLARDIDARVESALASIRAARVASSTPVRSRIPPSAPALPTPPSPPPRFPAPPRPPDPPPSPTLRRTIVERLMGWLGRGSDDR
jgi:hypothetical protein